MAEINITRFFREASPRDYAASRAELGENAGSITWRHAMEDAPDFMHLHSEELREDFRKYMKGFGAWEQSEIEGWSNVELEALFLQMVAGDIREADIDTSDPDWDAYEEGANAGRYSGRIYRGDNGEIYYYVGD